ncbi:hypothetical protein OAN61_00900 [bacterium]|nr:hypothetical protein [bacterium]
MVSSALMPALEHAISRGTTVMVQPTVSLTGQGSKLAGKRW